MFRPKHRQQGTSTLRAHLFAPILAGATLGERVIACFGALIGIGLTGFICGRLSDYDTHFPLIVAPMGASAVLLFAVPTSPLAQPWSIIGGNTISALVGVTVAHLVHTPLLASGIAVSLAIAAMSLTRCLHPPGGAAALSAVLGGPIVAASGFVFPFAPVGLNSLILVGLGYGFHKLSRRSYPHLALPLPTNTHQTADVPPQLRIGFRPEDIDAALKAMSETFDIERSDIHRLLRQVELQALHRSHGHLLCHDIMSRDVVSISVNASARAARALLLAHNIRTLPVVDDDSRLAGTVGLRELMDAEAGLRGHLSSAVTAASDGPALALVSALTDGRTHAVFIVSAEQKIEGMITQTDLLGALARMPSQSR
ncbi:HPP family protein [Bradyrhizobium sp. USDA 3256]